MGRFRLLDSVTTVSTVTTVSFVTQDNFQLSFLLKALPCVLTGRFQLADYTSAQAEVGWSYVGNWVTKVHVLQ